MSDDTSTHGMEQCVETIGEGELCGKEAVGRFIFHNDGPDLSILLCEEHAPNRYEDTET